MTAAARELFAASGYANTSIAEVARAAGVSSETIYKTFGTKRSILSEIIDVALTGDPAAAPMLKSELFGRVLAARTQRERLALLAKLTRTILERAGPIHKIIRDAAATDPEAVVLREKHQHARLMVQREFVRTLLELGPLRRGMTLAEGADMYWTTASPELHHVLTLERGWSQNRYEKWLLDTLGALLLPAS
ncbi:MAG: TetR/AcrR family transcriptional regulator [Candidatus Dormibacteria bacterium]